MTTPPTKEEVDAAIAMFNEKSLDVLLVEQKTVLIGNALVVIAEVERLRERERVLVELLKRVNIAGIAGRVYGTLDGALFETRPFGGNIQIVGTDKDSVERARREYRERCETEDLALIRAVHAWWGDAKKAGVI